MSYFIKESSEKQKVCEFKNIKLVSIYTEKDFIEKMRLKNWF